MTTAQTTPPKNVRYARWIAKPENRKALANRRKNRYKTDPEYQAAQKANAAAQRKKAKAKAGKARKEGYDLSLHSVAEDLGVSPVTVRAWRKRGLYPTPLAHGGRFWFTPRQQTLLHDLAKFSRQHGPRLSKDQEVKLALTAAYIHKNWKL